MKKLIIWILLLAFIALAIAPAFALENCTEADLPVVVTYADPYQDAVVVMDGGQIAVFEDAPTGLYNVYVEIFATCEEYEVAMKQLEEQEEQKQPTGPIDEVLEEAENMYTSINQCQYIVCDLARFKDSLTDRSEYLADFVVSWLDWKPISMLQFAKLE